MYILHWFVKCLLHIVTMAMSYYEGDSEWEASNTVWAITEGSFDLCPILICIRPYPTKLISGVQDRSFTYYFLKHSLDLSSVWLLCTTREPEKWLWLTIRKNKKTWHISIPFQTQNPNPFFIYDPTSKPNPGAKGKTVPKQVQFTVRAKYCIT